MKNRQNSVSVGRTREKPQGQAVVPSPSGDFHDKHQGGDDPKDLRRLFGAARVTGQTTARLSYFEGHPHNGMAAALGWPVGIVRGRLSRDILPKQ